MNKQGTKLNPAGGIEWTHVFGPGSGYTANPVRGCTHQCRWRMPDGQIALCYAEAQRDRLDGAGAFQKVTFHPEVLDAIRRHQRPAGIFIDSMSDLFATAVTDVMLADVLFTIRHCPQHRFFTLTKNPTRLAAMTKRGVHWPANLFLGVSLPPTFMFGKELTPDQQRAWFDKALACLAQCSARVRWVSLEPLSWDCSEILRRHRDQLHWAVIGAASAGARTHQPDWRVLREVLQALEGIPVFYKGNLKDSFTDTATAPRSLAWRQEFPGTPAAGLQTPAPIVCPAAGPA